MGENARGDTGLFPANYVELVEGSDEDAGPAPAPTTSSSAAAPGSSLAPAATTKGPTATALYDYEAAEDNEISFPEGGKIHNLVSRLFSAHLCLICRGYDLTFLIQEFPDEDWWLGEYPEGKQGLFPANYVQLDE